MGHARRAWQLFRALVDRRIVEFAEPTPDHPGKLRVNVELQDDFSMNQTLSLYLMDTLKLLDADSPEYALDLITLVEAILRQQQAVLWCSDPMHGNIETTSDGKKTRRFDKILQELERSFLVHKACGSHLGGVHFELTGDDVTECIGGASGVTEADLSRADRSQVDPRLNYEQALEMAMLLARLMAR